MCDEKFLSGLFSQLLVCVPSDMSVRTMCGGNRFR